MQLAQSEPLFDCDLVDVLPGFPHFFWDRFVAISTSSLPMPLIVPTFHSSPLHESLPYDHIMSLCFRLQLLLKLPPTPSNSFKEEIESLNQQLTQIAYQYYSTIDLTV